jgi:endonuclease YncB( thermonuclease family)
MRGTLLILTISAIAGAFVGAGPPVIGALSAAVVRDCQVVDGDTIRCGAERIRLLGIDAPEMPGHCRAARACVSGDPYASSSSLEQALTGSIRITRVGQDRYGRTLALVSGSRGDLSCWQLAHGQADYFAKWDDGYRVARLCPSATG